MPPTSSSTSLDVQVTSTINVFPSKRHNKPISTPLSIFDNVSANFARCAAVWFYDNSDDTRAGFVTSHLHRSLSLTLDYYPQWCGRLSYTPTKAKGGHNCRYQRIWVTYNTPLDIGVTFIIAKSSKTLSDLLPTIATRRSSQKAWDGHQIPAAQLLPKTRLAISTDQDAPNMIVQQTTFACGSTSIAIGMSHCLADAVAMSQFAKDWSSTSRALLCGQEPPVLTPLFDPQRLDSFAEGDIDTENPDPAVQSKARSLPQHRFDWYKAVEIQPWPTHLPADLDPDTIWSPSDPIPWHQWDTKAPVSLRVLHFTSSEIEGIYRQATSSPSAWRISKHDALLAHIWSRINASRQLTPGTTTYLDMTLGLRARISPPLPDSFLGSPITHVAIPSIIPSYPLQNTQTLSLLTSSIRSSLLMFTPGAIASILHDKAFEVAPQRLWAACLGREHILLTTWIHSGVYDVNFLGKEVATGMPVYVEALMPSYDGIVEVMEAPGRERYKEGQRWWSDGVDVSIYLEAKAMERLLMDEGLWGDESKSA
jgi:hypothetical protein